MNTTWLWTRMALGIGLALSAWTAGAQTYAPLAGHSGWLGGGDLIGSSDLRPYFAAALRKMGGRMTSANLANVAMAGTVKDANGSRQAKITVQAPGYLRYEEAGASRVLTFDGAAFNSKRGSLGAGDTQTIESIRQSNPTLDSRCCPAHRRPAAHAAGVNSPIL